jgi:hypothetical protein
MTGDDFAGRTKSGTCCLQYVRADDDDEGTTKLAVADVELVYHDSWRSIAWALSSVG